VAEREEFEGGGVIETFKHDICSAFGIQLNPKICICMDSYIIIHFVSTVIKNILIFTPVQ
jgi:hypothetical protein